jgi:checkpoint serine/threonine-protein kinase
VSAFSNFIPDKHLSTVRQSEAERIYRLGIERRARPFEKLKRLYNDFMERNGLSSTPSPKPEPPAKKMSSSHSHQTSQASTSKEPSRREPSRKEPSRVKEELPRDGYARMKGPPVAGKRREKLRVDLSLLMTPDGVEYCAAEARARSLGLLGKKWASLLAPPRPQGNQRPTILRVNFGEGTKTMSYGNTRRKSMLAVEPTVTINTKEALADVFGMFNSPEKTARSAKIPGSKHAPVKKVEPLTPMLRAAVVDRDKTPAPANRDENGMINKTPGRPPLAYLGA